MGIIRRERVSIGEISSAYDLLGKEHFIMMIMERFMMMRRRRNTEDDDGMMIMRCWGKKREMRGRMQKILGFMEMRKYLNDLLEYINRYGYAYLFFTV